MAVVLPPGLALGRGLMSRDTLLAIGGGESRRWYCALFVWTVCIDRDVIFINKVIATLRYV